MSYGAGRWRRSVELEDQLAGSELDRLALALQLHQHVEGLVAEVDDRADLFRLGTCEHPDGVLQRYAPAVGVDVE